MKRVLERTLRRLPEIIWMGLIATVLCLIIYELTGDKTFAKILLMLVALYHTRFNHIRDQKTQLTE